MKKGYSQDMSDDSFQPEESSLLLALGTSNDSEILNIGSDPETKDQLKEEKGLTRSSSHDKAMQYEYDDQVSPNPTNYEKASGITALHYSYAIKNINSTQKQVSNREMRLEDLPLLGKTEEVQHKVVELETEYQHYRKKHKTPSLFWPILRVFRGRILKEQASYIVMCVSKLLYSLFLSKVIECLEQQKTGEIYLWGGCLFFVIILSIYGFHDTSAQGYRFISQLKPSLIGLIYRKITRLSHYSISQISIGQTLNIVANDLNSMETAIFNLYGGTIAPFLLAGAMAILWSFMGAACISGMVLLLLIWIAQYNISNLGGHYLTNKNTVTDDRLKLTNEMVHGIRILKMNAWDDQFEASITKTRNEEAKLLRRFGYTDYFGGHLMARSFPALGSFVIFVTYYLMGGGTLKASQVYATIMMLSFLNSVAVGYLMLSLKLIIELRLTFGRIIRLLEVKEPESVKIREPKDKANGVEFKNFSAFWSDNQGDQQIPQNFEKPTLKNLTFSVQKGTLCALIGSVGSGKSTTLMTFLNEVPKTMGSLRFSGSLAYVEQEVVIFPGTVRSNILFGKPYDEAKFRRIVEACCLLDDFKEFANGDLTEIGERGINLSGGQKARTSLARALYSDADIYLLDDPLSAVDTKVAKDLFKKAIRGVLRDKTVILATHQVHFAREADKIIVLEDGKIKTQGTLEEIVKQDPSVLSMFKRNAGRSAGESDIFLTSQESISDQECRSMSHSIQDIQKELDTVEEEQDAEDASMLTPKEEEGGKLITKEQDESANLRIFWYYLRSVGSGFRIVTLILTFITMESLYILYTKLISNWTDGDWTPEFSMKVLGCLIAGFFVFLCLREKLFVDFAIKIASNIFRKALHRVIGAKVEFFDTNPAGRILSRFSLDMGVLDRRILDVQNEVFDAVFYVAAIFIAMCYFVPWLILPVAILILVTVTIAHSFKRPYIEGRGLELVTRSPIYALFSTTLSGLVSIRAYHQREAFNKEFIRTLNMNCRAFNYFYDTARIIGFYCDMIIGLFACICIAILIFYVQPEAATVGLIAVYILVLTNNLQSAIRGALDLTMQMSSAARLKAYTEIPQEAPLIQPIDKHLTDQSPPWPFQGEVAFNNIYMKYRQNTDHVLKGLTFSVKPGEKIGCVGRTGAGKSSILQALFRMVEIDNEAVPDSSIIIDGVDISKVGLHTLRKSISIIPQSPFVFTGTVKSNLDPFNRYTDEEIISVLKETKLWRTVSSLPKGLETNISNEVSALSVGQKQLMCLARTLLQKNKILALDEATANIDFVTDNFIQQKIMEKFKDSTIFTIAHRLSTVANYDKVLVMDKGRAVELDHPYRLLVKNVGDDSITNTEGVFASMVLNTGSRHSKVIFEIAKKNFFDEK